MDYKEILRVMLGKSGNTQKGLAKKIGKSPSAITMLFRREGLRVYTMVQLCEAMGFEVIIRPQNYVRLMDEEMRLENE